MVFPHDQRFKNYGVKTEVPSAGLNAVQDAILGMSGGATAYVLAYGASSKGGTRRGDWVCDGVADEVQIQAAIDWVAAQGGGSVILSEGTFVIASKVETNSLVTVYGQGRFATKVIIVDNAGANFGAFEGDSVGMLRLAHFSIDANGPNQGGGEANACLYLDGCANLLIDDMIFQNAVGGGVYGHGVYMTGCEEIHIRHSLAADCEEFGFVAGADSVIDHCRALQNKAGFFCGLNSSFMECRAEDHTSQGFIIAGVDVRILGGRATECYEGVYIPTGGDRCSIAGMHIDLNDRNGISASGADCRIENNIIHSNSQENDDTYSGIELNSADDTHVTKNTIRTKGSGNEQKYGVNVTAGSDTYVYGNDLKGSCKTGGNEVNGTMKTCPEWIGSSGTTNCQNDATKANII